MSTQADLLAVGKRPLLKYQYTPPFIKRMQAMSEKKSVLVSLNERNRVVDFSGSSLSDLVNVVKEAFKDLIDETAQLVLQLKDESWGGVFIDVQDIEVVKDRRVLRVLMQNRNSEKVLKFGLFICCGYIKCFDFFPSQVTVNIACKHQIVMALQKDCKTSPATSETPSVSTQAGLKQLRLKPTTSGMVLCQPAMREVCIYRR